MGVGAKGEGVALVSVDAAGGPKEKGAALGASTLSADADADAGGPNENGAGVFVSGADAAGDSKENDGLGASTGFAAGSVLTPPLKEAKGLATGAGAASFVASAGEVNEDAAEELVGAVKLREGAAADAGGGVGAGLSARESDCRVGVSVPRTRGSSAPSGMPVEARPRLEMRSRPLGTVPLVAKAPGETAREVAREEAVES
jgi:hypothetical protein